MNTIKKIWPIIAITLIAAGFVVAVIYNRNFKESKREEAQKESMRLYDEELGYTPEDYITLGQYKGLEYKKQNTTVTEKQIKEAKESDLTDYRDVDRAAKKGDCVDVAYTAYVDGKEDDNLSTDCYSMILGEEELDKKVDKAIMGQSAGYKFEVAIENPDYFDMEDSEVDYEGVTVDFKFEILTVQEPYLRELTDQWVAEFYGEQGISTVEEYNSAIYNAILEENISDAETKENEMIQEMVMKSSTMNGYPDIVYNDIKDAVDGSLEYEAEETWGMTVQEYVSVFEIDLEKTYMDDVKWELIKRAIAKVEGIVVSEEEVQEGYEKYYKNADMDSPEEMREKYTDEEVKDIVVEAKVFELIKANAKTK